MIIRIATEKDIGSLVYFCLATALETEEKILNEEILRNGVQAIFTDPTKGLYFVAEENGGIVGGLMVTQEWSDWRNAWYWWIQSVYVVPEARGKGVYPKMYEFVKAKAAEDENVCGFRLYVENENVLAQKVYEKAGMKKSYYLMYEEKINAEAP